MNLLTGGLDYSGIPFSQYYISLTCLSYGCRLELQQDASVFYQVSFGFHVRYIDKLPTARASIGGGGP